ncbi:MAG TPA: LD-carboxypeptidase [Allosphingosinicella sp.]|nr:LD-carboxypeptidase [Allosphingosinicella sp.]
MRIAVVAPSTPLAPELAERVLAQAARDFPEVELVFHPQCFLRHRHFAGEDAVRAAAFVGTANDPAFEAIWCARGGYGSNRIAEAAIAALAPAARNKAYLGYSDAGFLFAGLYRAGFKRLAHGPMAMDIRRENGEAATARALGWLSRREPEALEPSIDGSLPTAAFNITVLSQLLGTALEPDLSGHVLMLEEVAEHMYRTDRALFHITGNPTVRRVAGIRFGRCTEVLANDPDFGMDAEDVVRHWCGASGIAYLGRADIGHDAANKVVPFGRLR